MFVERERDALAGPDVKKRKDARRLLGKALECGQDLEWRYLDPHDGMDATYEEVTRWVDDARDFIEDAFGKGEAAAFLNDAGVPFNEDPMSARIEQYGQRYNIKARLSKLCELNRQAPQLPVEEGFDPGEWERRFTLG